MGLLVEKALSQAADFELSVRADPALKESPGPPRSTRSLSSLQPGEVAGVIDFSSTTGLTESDRATLGKASREIRVCWAPNFSVGVPLLVRALRAVSEMLPQGWGLEIVDIHHDRKRDAPSGTALQLAETWRTKRGGRLIHGREGMIGPRESGEIGLHALRLGDVVGEHRILLGGPGETLEAVHRVGDRGAFVNGSVEALRRLLRRGPGLYEWEDLLSGA
jgi:4-hydroxy-tetrahydrodipicolinate reductase